MTTLPPRDGLFGELPANLLEACLHLVDLCQHSATELARGSTQLDHEVFHAGIACCQRPEDTSMEGRKFLMETPHI